ncbi:hypothetical protein CVU37_07935 [candidate division BRC1 bacterium HGW-BRC1-1]|nr:MAG: hypothetical protein CVU37_07935 [candidate division BRC1 bacterium HGW-BRC1-1]
MNHLPSPAGINSKLRWCVMRFRPFVLAAVLVVGVLPGAHAQNSLVNPPYTVDALVLVEGGRDLLKNATPDGVRVGPSGGVELIEGRTAGSLTLAPQTAPFGFNELIPSWNGHAPAGTGFKVWMRAGNRGEALTPWFEAGTWGDVPDEPTSRMAQFAHGIYNVDYLVLNRPATIVEVRVDLVRPRADATSPQFSMLALSYTNTLGDRDLYARQQKTAGGTVLKLPGKKAIQHDVPFRSQVVPTSQWIGRICSPASVSMCTAYFKSPMQTQQMAGLLYDPVSDLFGVWHRSIMGASEAGVRGYLKRFRSWDTVRAELARGSVLCVSIRMKKGELKEPPRVYQRRGTEGHLIVLKGLTADGKAIVHDSASKDHGPNSVFLQEDLAKAWFDKGGVTYVFTGPRK